MNKKYLILFFIILLIAIAIVLFMTMGNKKIEEKNEIELNNEIEVNEIETNNIIERDNEVIDEKEEEMSSEELIDTIHIKVNDEVLDLKLEDNSATRALVEKLKEDDVVVNASEYGGFEKVGSLGFSLPRSDKNISTSYGDVVLYQGNQISLFYDSNSWSYTRIGKIEDVSQKELKDILGNGDVTLVLTIK